MGLGGGKGVYPLVAHWHCEPAIFGLVAGTQSITQPIFFTPLLAFSAGPCPARGVSGVGSSVGDAHVSIHRCRLAGAGKKGGGGSRDKPTFARGRACERVRGADERRAAVINKHRRSRAPLPAGITPSPICCRLKASAERARAPGSCERSHVGSAASPGPGGKPPHTPQGLAHCPTAVFRRCLYRVPWGQTRL